MTNRWLVGIDGSADSRSALDWALLHAGERAVDLTAAFVTRVSPGARLRDSVVHQDSHEPSVMSNARHELDLALADVPNAGAIERLPLTGSPGRALVEAAHEASLLVVGRHGADAGWQRALGSVSRYCAIHAAVPTVVVPAGWDRRPTDRIIVGFDGSDHAVAALRWAFEFAAPDSSITAVIALEVAPWLRQDIIEARLEHELREEEGRLHDLIDAADPDHRADRHVIVRGARAALTDAARDADVVVVGAHGAGRVATALMGSVSTWMLDASDRPTVVVPEPD